MTNEQYEVVKQAMDQHAMNIAIAYGEWVDANAVRNGHHEWTVGCGHAKKSFTSEQLYKKFIQEITQTSCQKEN